MKRLCAILLLLAGTTFAQQGNQGIPSGGSSNVSSTAPAKFQRLQTTTYTNTTTSPATSAFGSNVAVGQLLIAIVTVFGGSPSTPTDTLGNTWIQAGSFIGNNALFYTRSNIGSGSDTVSVVFSGSRCFLTIAAYSGQAVSGVIVDTIRATAGGVNTAANSGMYVANPGELLITTFSSVTSGQTWSAFGGGYTLQQQAGFATWGDNLSSSSGLNNATTTLSVADNWNAKTWAFLPAGLPTPVPLSFVRTTETWVKDVGAPPTSPAQVSFQAGNTPGNTIYLFEVQYFGTQDQTLSITDTQGNTYSRCAQGTLNNTGNNAWGVVYCAPNVPGGTGANTITVNFSGLADAMEIFGVELSGGSSVDTYINPQTGSGSTASGTLTLANPNETVLLLGSVISAVNIPAMNGNNLSGYFSPGVATPGELVVNIISNPPVGNNAIAVSAPGALNGVGVIALGLIPTGINNKLLPNVVQAGVYQTASNCSSSASPAVCGSAASGSVAVPAGTNPTLQVNTSAVTASSQILLMEDESLGTKLGVTCQTAVLPTATFVTARIAFTSFTFQANGTFATNPVCYSYTILN